MSQVANILFYLGPRLKLAPEAESDRHILNALQLTIADLVAEVARHPSSPISTALYYEDQKAAAKTNAKSFLAHRAPKYLAYFERVAASSRSDMR